MPVKVTRVLFGIHRRHANGDVGRTPLRGSVLPHLKRKRSGEEILFGPRWPNGGKCRGALGAVRQSTFRVSPFTVTRGRSFLTRTGPIPRTRSSSLAVVMLTISSPSPGGPPSRKYQSAAEPKAITPSAMAAVNQRKSASAAPQIIHFAELDAVVSEDVVRSGDVKEHVG